MSGAPCADGLALLRGWLLRQLPADAARWLAGQLDALATAPTENAIGMAIGQAAGRLGEARLHLDASDLAAAEVARGGWQPGAWSVDQAGRVALLLAAATDVERFPARLERLCRGAGAGELGAIYRGLPLYPTPERHRARAAAGVRGSVRAVFEAVALHNPYPAEQLDEGIWNQLVLKALLIGVRLAPIHGLEARANPALTRTLCDYARERWAAHRPVSPELWRCVAIRADDDALDCLARALDSSDPREQAGAALALAHSDDPAAPELLLSVSGGLRERISGGRLDWETLD